MTRLFNDPAAFADEMTEGFVASHRRWVRRVSGGVARRTATREGGAAIVVGGGSGHYPAFAGLVGPGLAHGAAMGNLFASPSAQQVYSVAKAVEAGGGVLLAYGNYAGDVLHFTQAQERLRAEGIECESIAVTDDVSSASLAERHKRRGIAGDLTVFKVAGAAAEEGRTLAQVHALAVRANERTRSLGVAFTGCTLPGAREPLFTVPAGRMAVGMGIHGEPGIGEQDVPSADELAELLVTRLLAEVPDGVQARGARAVPILNGLGGVKYEELFVVYRRVAGLLAGAGIEAVDPQVGELVTSFDMAGTSLTLFWLDEELERLWLAPVDAPSFRRGSVDITGDVLPDGAEAAEAEVPPSSAPSREAAARVLAALEAARATVDANADELGRIDAIAGDGDHGIGMQRGVHAAADAASRAVARGAGTGTALAWAGTRGPTARAAPRARCGAWPCGPSARRRATTTHPTARASPPASRRPRTRSPHSARPNSATRPSSTRSSPSAASSLPEQGPSRWARLGARPRPRPNAPPRPLRTCSPASAARARTRRRASEPRTRARSPSRSWSAPSTRP